MEIDKNFFMLCYSTTKQEINNFSNEKFKANIKYDGERIIAVKKGDDIFLINRNGREKSFIYPEVKESLNALNFDFIFDGEVITTNGKFNSLQHRSNLADREKIRKAVKENPVIFMIFDVISFKGEDLRNKPLKERIKYLKEVDFISLKSVGFAVYENIRKCLDNAEREKLEGIVIKNMESRYEHRRSDSWLKLKFFKEMPLLMIRYSENPKGIRAEDKELNAIQIAGIMSRVVKKEIDERGSCPIIAQYLEKTNEGRLRFPSFKEVILK